MILEVKDISKQYKTKIALHDVNLTLSNGVYGLVGPNGAGKTTLINIIVDVLKASKGNIFYNGKNINDDIENYLDLIGYLPQYPKFYGNFKCIEFLKYMCELKGIPKKSRNKKIRESLEICNLVNEENRKICEFSGGMKQRLGIAQAIINNPKLLILDEPTAGLDPKERIRFRNIISNLSTDRIVILATHIMEDIESIANQVILIQNGSIIGVKNTQELLKEIQNKVWIMEVKAEDVTEFEQNYLVSNIIHNTCDKCTIRYISDKKLDNSISVSPKLEEVYLYYFDNGEKI